MPELTWRSPSFPDQEKKCLIKHLCEYLRQTYDAIFQPNTQIRKTSVVQLRLIVLPSFLSHLRLPGAAKQGLEDDCSVQHKMASPALPPSLSADKRGGNPGDRGSPDIFQEHLPFRQASLRANKPLANVKPVF